MDSGDDQLRHLIVIGSSAGGLDVLGQIVERLEPGIGAPLVVAQHLDPRRPSHLTEILRKRTKLPVVAVEGSIELTPGTVHVLPPGRDIQFRDGHLVVGGEPHHRPTPWIDQVFISAAESYGEGLIAVVLTGGGSDGAIGTNEVKARGGVVVVQRPDSATSPSMPESISRSVIDVLANPDEIGKVLSTLLAPQSKRRGEDDRVLAEFLDEVRDRSGIDFGAYKPGTIRRRLQRRMVATGSARLRDYVGYLEEHPDEYRRLTSSFLIKVTQFFRDADLFDHLRDAIIPKLVADARRGDRTIRIWSAGCATGEEAYSMAMLVADALGPDLSQFNVRVFATDVDTDAIAFARRGLYSAGSVEGVPETIRERHFTKVGDLFEVSKAVRALVVFGLHDLGHRAPFPRVDVAVCRNVLIYFTPELQKRSLQLFAFALRNDGYLVLGKAESTAPLPEHFAVEDARLKIYRRIGERIVLPPRRLRDAPLNSSRLLPARGRRAVAAVREEPMNQDAAPTRADAILSRLPVGICVVDRRYDIQSINAEARRLLGIHGTAIGDDLVHLIKGDASQQIKASLDQVFRSEEAPTVVLDLGAPGMGETGARAVEVTCFAIDAGDVDLAALVTFDVTRAMGERRALEGGLQDAGAERGKLVEQVKALTEANRQLLRANEELTGANADLRSSNEELLLADEEVQAATEEVETLNEELQATNEELETLNEELEATVEELNATNDDLETRTRGLEADASAAATVHRRVTDEREMLLAILDALDEAVLVVDQAGLIVKANKAFRDRFGDPLELDIRSEGGAAFSDGDDPRIRSASEAFAMTARFGDEAVELEGRPVEIPGGPYGVLRVKGRS